MKCSQAVTVQMNGSEMEARTRWHRRPYIGLAALAAGLLGQWFRHAIFPLTRAWFGEFYYWSLLAVGLLGIWLVWKGLDEAEIPATWKGYLGGLFIWVGWFEFGFHYFAEKFNIPAYQATERLVSSADLNLVQASFPIFAAIFILYGLFNRQTKCNMMRWLHRAMRMNPGQPSSGNQRSFARITALETIFVIWFCYAVWLFITYFGASIVILGVAYLLWAAWFAYIFFRLLKIPRPGYAFRYGIPVGIIGWVLIATPSHMGLFPVIWLRPFDYPITSLIAAGVFAGTIVLFSGAARQQASS